MALDPGTYTAKAANAVLTESKNGTPCVQVEFQADEGTITWWGYLTEKTVERTLEALRYCGWSNDDLSDMKGIGSRAVQIVVANETYEGVTRAKVQWVNDPNKLSFESRMDETAQKAFAKKMKGYAMASRKHLPEEESDDIPF